MKTGLSHCGAEESSASRMTLSGKLILKSTEEN